jgi:hypothetical protein
MITIPTVSDGTERAYRQVVRLDGADFVLGLAWNGRLGYWVLDLSLLDGTALIQGVPVVLWTDLLRSCVDVRRPLGELLSWPVDAVLEPAGLRDLGTRVMLAYREAATDG